MSRYALHQAVADHDRGRAGHRAPDMDRQALHRGQGAARAGGGHGQPLSHGVDGGPRLRHGRGLRNRPQSRRAADHLAAGAGQPGDAGAGRQVSSHGQTRTRSFRQSFLAAYATRIGERLDATNTTVTAEVEDSRLLPVLAARSRAADELTDRLFPSMVHRALPASNRAGWGAGRAAADLALLEVHDLIAG